MKQLLLMRHAKSDWADPGAADFDRPLNERGRAAAPLMGNWLKANALEPELALVSPARRTMETWSGLRLEGVPLRTEAQLYPGDAGRILGLARALPKEVSRALILGHQPGLWELCYFLLGEEAPEEFPTAAIFVITNPGDWPDFGHLPGRLAAHVTPRGLQASQFNA
jgi:phosphohistidine phosphatase